MLLFSWPAGSEVDGVDFGLNKNRTSNFTIKFEKNNHQMVDCPHIFIINDYHFFINFCVKDCINAISLFKPQNWIDF